jgi:hypothetical protein
VAQAAGLLKVGGGQGRTRRVVFCRVGATRCGRFGPAVGGAVLMTCQSATLGYAFSNVRQSFGGWGMKALIASVLLVTAGPAWAEWSLVAEDTSDKKYYVNLASIRATGHLRRYWELQNLPSPDEWGARSYRAFVEVDCKEKRRRSLQINHFPKLTLPSFPGSLNRAIYAACLSWAASHARSNCVGLT